MGNDSYYHNVIYMKSKSELQNTVDYFTTSLKKFHDRYDLLIKSDEYKSTSEFIKANKSSLIEVGLFDLLFMNISTPTEIISKDIEAYVKTINDIRINLIDENHEFAYIDKNADGYEDKEITSLNLQIKNIARYFENDGKNFIEQLDEAGLNQNKLEGIIQNIPGSAINDLDKKVMTKASMELLAWTQSIQDLAALVSDHDSDLSKTIADDFKSINNHITNNDSNLAYDLLRKYHYGDDDSFPFSITNSGKLLHDARGAGGVDVCVIATTKSGSVFGVHSEPSATKISEVLDFESDSLIRHREHLLDVVPKLLPENLESRHIFDIDWPIFHISKKNIVTNINLIKDIFLHGLEVGSKMRGLSGNHDLEFISRNTDSITGLIADKNIYVNGIKSSLDFDKLKEELGQLSKESILDLVDVFKDSSKEHWVAFTNALNLTLFSIHESGGLTHLSSVDLKDIMSHSISNENYKGRNPEFDRYLDKIKHHYISQEHKNELMNSNIDNLVYIVTEYENFGSGDPIGKKTQELIDMAETNSYAAHHLVKLFDDNGLHKDANGYRGLAKSYIDTKSAPDTSPKI